jgi:hypothetical protein
LREFPGGHPLVKQNIELCVCPALKVESKSNPTLLLLARKNFLLGVV